MAIVMMNELVKLAKSNNASQPILRSIAYWAGVNKVGVTDRHRAIILDSDVEIKNDMVIDIDTGIPSMGNYPNLLRVVPTGLNVTSEINALLPAWKSVKALGKDGVVTMTFDNGQMMIDGVTIAYVEGETEAYETTKMSAKYLYEMLDVVNKVIKAGSQVTFNWTSPLQPFFISWTAAPNVTSGLYLLTPVRSY